MRTKLLLITLVLIVAGCSEPVKYEFKVLGNTVISDHRTPIAGLGRRLCLFRVEVAGLKLGYSGSSLTLKEHNKCLTMKNGDDISISQRIRMSGTDNLQSVFYFGRVNEIEFVLQ